MVCAPSKTQDWSNISSLTAFHSTSRLQAISSLECIPTMHLIHYHGSMVQALSSPSAAMILLSSTQPSTMSMFCFQPNSDWKPVQLIRSRSMEFVPVSCLRHKNEQWKRHFVRNIAG